MINLIWAAMILVGIITALLTRRDLTLIQTLQP